MEAESRSKARTAFGEFIEGTELISLGDSRREMGRTTSISALGKEMNMPYLYQAGQEIEWINEYGKKDKGVVEEMDGNMAVIVRDDGTRTYIDNVPWITEPIDPLLSKMLRDFYEGYYPK